MDTEVRRLELLLAGEPGDLDARQRLLKAYLRAGTLGRNEIFDLAALGDPGALAIASEGCACERKVTLESRTKRFYLRCAWVITKIVMDQTGFFPNYSTSPVLTTLWGERSDLAGRIVHSIEVFSELMEDYLAGRTSHKATRPYRYFHNDAGITLRNFERIFEDLERDIYHWSTQPYTQDRPGSLLLQYVLDMLRNIAAATDGNVKRNTDDTLQLAVSVLNGLRGLFFTPYDTNECNVQLWEELIQQGITTSIPPTAIIGPNAPGAVTAYDEDLYFQTASRQLLRTYRNQIINHWLPSYTP